ncbi:MAG: ATP-grasp domain-containing protein [Capsulimonas sp.]|uniref:ATP-grasp domain-containing protein n=1 Tax=Capsulimonas sp. TaxID=2494211 RepID=UPI003266DD80
MERSYGILNAGDGAWAFEEHAQRLSRILGAEIITKPREFNYVLSLEDEGLPEFAQSFIPLASLLLASDKRLLATAFQEHGVATPATILAEDAAEVMDIVRENGQCKWCLKWPIGCGGSGHRVIETAAAIPADWPRPYVVQEFIPMTSPEVYRIFGCEGEIFGWLARKFPEDTAASPWVSHARGARYVSYGSAPIEAQTQARLALKATGLLDSFGCVDLIARPSGEWLVLEVGSDGVYNHVDRDIGDLELVREIEERLGQCFQSLRKSY